MVEPQPSKLMVRVRFPPPAPVLDVFSSCSSGVEHTLGKGEVDGSIPSMSSILHKGELSSLFLFSLVSLMSVEGCQAESYPLIWRPLLRRQFVCARDDTGQ